MLVSDLTVEELKLLIRETVSEMFDSMLSEIESIDPDAGKTLKAEFVTELLESFKRTQMGERGTPLADAAKELGVDLG
ncbi:MAG: hypothetical protein ACFB16_00315 [Phormidesmis sp.]